MICSLGSTMQFQFTPPRGGRQVTVHITDLRDYFNSRPRVGGDVWFAVPLAAVTLFQFTPPRGGRPVERVAAHAVVNISIHAPAWGATRRRRGQHRTRRIISIHAPAWGATDVFEANFLPLILFQFTPPRGGRRTVPPRAGNGCYFNSRPRVGGDKMQEVGDAGKFISIHAPAWGATSTSPTCKASPAYFNSRPRVGGDSNRFSPRRKWMLFQFTPPRGGRLRGEAVYQRD